MNSMKKALIAFWNEEEGLTMVEYAIAGALVAAGCVTAFTALGTKIAAFITYLASVIPAA